MLRSFGPPARAGQSIGLFGGSFDPPHAGHLHVSRVALARVGLDRVWWLVSPGNPLKRRGPAPLERRLAAARAIVDHPRIAVTAFEAAAGTRFTAETIAALQAAYPGVRFLWIMGADNLAQFHRWERWREIAGRVPMVVIARPGDRISARVSKAARVLRRARIPAARAAALPGMEPPAWSFLNAPMSGLSSTAIRERGDWPG